MSLGPAEVLVILVVALMVFGPKRLPEVGRQVGGALRELRRVQDSVRVELSDALRAEPRAVRRPDAPSEPDHEAVPPLAPPERPEPIERGFEGPPGSFT
jgi:sec-independent protein translocase protein TatA